jgi:hypothetical protein
MGLLLGGVVSKTNPDSIKDSFLAKRFISCKFPIKSPTSFYQINLEGSVMTDVFFQGYGRWCGYYAPYPDSIFDNPDYRPEDYSHYTGVFKLPENSEKRYQYAQEIVTLTLHPNISHKDRANFPCEDILNYVVPESRKIPELANFFKMALFGTLWFEIDQDREYILIPLPEKIESTETTLVKGNSKQNTALSLLNSDADYISDKLKALYLAAQKYWQNADPDDTTTHPLNQDVEKWLIENHQYAKKAAATGATLIRPKWAAKGVRPKE